MFDSYLRALKDRLGAPIAQRLVNVGPNAISLLGLVAGINTALFAFFGYFGVALAFWLVNRFLDGLDGLVARLHNQQDDFGGYLDILSDFVVYAAVPIGLVLGSPSPSRYAALIAMLAAFYINTASWMYLAAILEKRSARSDDTLTTIVMPSGLVGGFETIVFFSLFFIFPSQVTLLFSIFSALIIFTIFQRLIWAKRVLNPVPVKGKINENQYISPRIYSEE